MKRIVLLAVVIALALPPVIMADDTSPSSAKPDYISQILNLNEQLDKDTGNDDVLNRMIALHEAMLKEEPKVEPPIENDLSPIFPENMEEAPYLDRC